MHGLAPQQIPPDLGGLDPVPTIPQSPYEPPLDDEGEAQPPAPLPPPGPAAPAILPAPALAQVAAPQRTSALAWVASLPPWLVIVVLATPVGQRLVGIEHADPVQERAAIVAQVRQEVGAETKIQLDALRQELARDRETHERQHALEERGAQREVAALREEVRLLREALTTKRR